MIGPVRDLFAKGNYDDILPKENRFMSIDKAVEASLN